MLFELHAEPFTVRNYSYHLTRCLAKRHRATCEEAAGSALMRGVEAFGAPASLGAVFGLELAKK